VLGFFQDLFLRIQATQKTNCAERPTEAKLKNRWFLNASKKMEIGNGKHLSVPIYRTKTARVQTGESLI